MPLTIVQGPGQAPQQSVVWAQIVNGARVEKCWYVVPGLSLLDLCFFNLLVLHTFFLNSNL